MDLAFTCEDPTNARIIDSQTEDVLFETSTVTESHVTNIIDPLGKIVGEWMHRPSDPLGEITFRGEKKRVSDWLSKKNVLSSTRVFLAPDGKSYHWKKDEKARGLKLENPETQDIIAESYSQIPQRAEDLQSSPLMLKIREGAKEMLDAILLSFVVLEHGRWFEEHVRLEKRRFHTGRAGEIKPAGQVNAAGSAFTVLGAFLDAA